MDTRYCKPCGTSNRGTTAGLAAQCASYQISNRFQRTDPGGWSGQHAQTAQQMTQPGQWIEQPGQVMGQPGQVMCQPDQLMGQPGQWKGQPGQLMGQPGQWTGQPGQLMGQPGQWTGQPGQRMGQPGQWTGQPRQSARIPGQRASGQRSGQPCYWTGQKYPQPQTTYPPGYNDQRFGQENNVSCSRPPTAEDILKSAVAAATSKSPCTCANCSKLATTDPAHARILCEVNSRMDSTGVPDISRPHWSSSYAPGTAAHRRNSADSSSNSSRSRGIHAAPCVDPESYRQPSKMGILVRNTGSSGQNIVPGRGGPSSRPESKLSLRFAPTDQVRDMSTTETIQPSRATCINEDEGCTEEFQGTSSKPPAGDGTGSLVTGSNPELTGYNLQSDLDMQARPCDSGPCDGYMVGPWPPRVEEECQEEEEEPPRAEGPCPPRPPCIRRRISFGNPGDTKCVPCPPKKPPDLDFSVFPRFGANRPKGGRLRMGKPPLGLEKRVPPLLAVACPRSVGVRCPEGRLLLGRTPAACWAAAANGLNCKSMCDAYIMTYPPTPEWYKEFLNCVLPEVPARGRCLVCAGPPPPNVMCAALAKSPDTQPCKKIKKKKTDNGNVPTCDFGFIVEEPECEKVPYMEQITPCDLETTPPVMSAPALPQAQPSGTSERSKTGSLQVVLSAKAVQSKVESAKGSSRSKLMASSVQPLKLSNSSVPVASAQPVASAGIVPVASAQPVSSPRPASSAQPVASAQPVGSSLPPAASAQPVTSAQPVGSSLAPAASAQPVTSAQPVGSSLLPTASVQPVASAMPVTSPRSVASQPVASAVPVTSPRPGASAVPIASPRSVSSSQPVPSAVPVASAQPVASPYPAASAQPVASAVPVASPKPVASAQPVPSAQASAHGATAEGSQQALE